MKNCFILFILLLTLPSAQPLNRQTELPLPKPSQNLIIITIDGFRWQEIFSGADESLISDPGYTPDTATMKMLYGGKDENERRQRLMPFFWRVISRKGQLYGNRHFRNKVNTANLYSVSYPGYNEIFTGSTDLVVSSNKKKKNDHLNVLEYLNGQPDFKDRVVAFTSWDVFPYILNEERSGMLVNSGYETVEPTSAAQALINKVQDEVVVTRGGTRHDQLSFLAAMEYLQQHKPRVLFLGLGETDEFAHQGRYDRYLEQANAIDQMIGQLWHWVQQTPGYRDNTSLIITTDHGRGARDSKWTSHSAFIRGSSQTWLAMMGPGVEPLGEVKQEQQFYQQQLAAMIAKLLGEDFSRS